MIAFRRILVAAIATLLLAGACTSINLPSIPAINIPTLPPLGGITNPGFTIPPFALPSGFDLPGIALPSADANSGVCLLVSPAEMSQILGAQVTVTSNDSDSCSYTLPSFSTVIVTVDTSSSDLSGLQFLVGASGQQSTIGGFPALSGLAIGQPTTWVQTPKGQLQVLGVLLGGNPAQITQTQQIAQLAVSRMQ